MILKERRTKRHLVFSVCAGVLAVLVLACAGTAAGAAAGEGEEGA
jgi:hypothetical protein